MENRTIVQYHSSHSNYSCGYCKGSRNSSHGMTAHVMTVKDYQDLIDRGWRRSGTYCYKPILDQQCCPSYTIKQDSLEFSISKSQKKIIKSLNKFLRTGEISKQPDDSNEAKESRKEKPIEEKKMKSVPKPGVGPDPSKPHCKKAKERRKEERLAKKALSSSEKPPKSKSNQQKSLEDFLNEISDNPKHKLKTKLVTSHDLSEYDLEVSHKLFMSYQMTIHNDIPSECDRESFQRFLVETPLIPEVVGDVTYGSFHQQYWLDDRLIAVGVIDILPKCVSSVYLFYDPEFNFLTLGTYSALREIAFIRELHTKANNIQYYYMGFYIHSCPKMRYKGQYHPSFLLCPESYGWYPIEECKVKLDQTKYCRFSNREDKDENSISDLRKIIIYRRGKIILYETYQKMHNSVTEDIREYACLVGKKCAERMIIVR